MRLLLVAPGICTPYTEGRKRFVLDLSNELAREDEVFLLTTTKAGQHTRVSVPHQTVELGHGSLHLVSLIMRLPRMIREFRPDMVCVFPYGTFRHIYGYASKWFMAAVDRICRHYAVSCQTIMYSIDEHADPRCLQRYVSSLVLGPRPDWDGPVVNLGLDCTKWALPQSQTPKRRHILFMAGMWETTEDRVDHVIDVRGLGMLLQAGSRLAEQGVKLVAAAPLFSSEKCRDYARSHRLNTWPEAALEFRAEVVVPDIYGVAELFVFPYGGDITHFVPTSVLESMLSGTAVAFSASAFLLPLAQGGSCAYLFDAGDVEQMTQVILEALDHVDERRRRAENARQYVLGNWCVEKSAGQIRALARSAPIL